MAGTRVRHVRVAETLADELRASILKGEFPDGYIPTQHQLAAERGVGLPSVREALRVLEAEGLIIVRRGNQGGARIRTPTPDSASFSLGMALHGCGATLDELGAALRHFEPLCARLCATLPPERRSFGTLHGLNQEAQGLLDDEVAFTRCAREFHAALVELCPNRAVSVVVQSLVSLWTVQEEAWAERASAAQSYPETAQRAEVVRAHQKVVREIERGNADAAERAARAHLEASQLYVMGRFGPQPLAISRPNS